MKIAIIGTHATGKTELCKQLAGYFHEKGVTFTLITEVARKCPFPINEDTSLKAQEWIIAHQIKEEQAADTDVILTDRSVLDNYVYLYMKLGEDHEALKSLMLNHLKTYDFLFLTTIQSPKIIDDGFRSTNNEYQREIDEIINKKIHDLENFLKENNVEVIPIKNFNDIIKVMQDKQNA